MKTFTKIFGIIAMAVIAAGLIACTTIPPTEEELALRNTLENASWKVEKLANPPSLNGFENIIKLAYSKTTEWEIMTESQYFRSAAGYSESDRDSEITIKSGGNERTIKRIGLDRNTWYKLTAPELPGITYYYYLEMPEGGSIGTTSIYKNKQ